MSDQDIQKKMQGCSRHRAKFAPPSTPEHFWSVDFMDTPECEERGEILSYLEMKIEFTGLNQILELIFIYSSTSLPTNSKEKSGSVPGQFHYAMITDAQYHGPVS